VPESELIKVPSCQICNNGASKDDEYFKIVHNVAEGADDNPMVQRIRPSVNRALTRPQAKGLFKSIAGTLRLEPQFTPSGLFAGHKPTFEIDVKRLHNVIRRVTRGLYFRERNQILPNEAVVNSYWARHINSDFSERGQTLRRVVSYVMSKPETAIGERAFSYWMSFYDEFDDPPLCVSAWVFRFYNSMDYVAMTGLKDDVVQE
jgi:hypothetical protein